MASQSDGLLIRHRRSARWTAAILVALLASGITILVARSGLLDGFDWKVYDRRMMAVSDSSEVVIVEIDDTSIDSLRSSGGRIEWPWPREAYGMIVDVCRGAGARAILFDIVMAEEGSQTSNGMFVPVLEAAPDVYMAAFFDERPGLHQLGRPQVSPEILERHAVPVSIAPGAVAPTGCRSVLLPYHPATAGLPSLLAATHGIGHVRIQPESDGVVRRIEPFVEYDGRSYAFLGLRVAWDLLGRPALSLEPGALRIGDRRLPLDDEGRVALRFAIDAHPRIGAHVVIGAALERMGWPRPPGNVAFDPALLDGKVVVVGATATALSDFKPTPRSQFAPGLESHATMIDNVLAGRAIDRRWDGPGPTAAWIALALIVAIVASWRPDLRGATVWFVVLSATWATVYLAFQGDVSLRATAPSLALVLALIGGAATGAYLESRLKEWVQGAFSQFLSRQVLDQLMADPERLTTGGERIPVTVFFSDIEGFTSLSENLEPEVLVRYLNRYLSRMSDRLLAEGGYIDKFIGDAIMAFWNAPVASGDHAARACRAALACLEAMNDLAAEFEAEGMAGFTCRIGLHSGTAVCGMMGSTEKLNYTVIGDAVNTASRLEGVNKEYGTRILVSDAVLREAGDGFETREVDLLRVKGRREPIRVHELLGATGRLPEAMARCRERYLEGLALYRDRRWTEALARFEAAAADDHPGLSPSTVHVERCRAYLDNPPPDDFDGVFTLTSK